MQAQGYVARSAFKLLEIQQKHKLIPQVSRCRMRFAGSPMVTLPPPPTHTPPPPGPAKKGGRVVGVDLQETRRPDKFCDDRVSIVLGDARLLGPQFWMEHCPGGFDAVLSDMWVARQELACCLTDGCALSAALLPPCIVVPCMRAGATSPSATAWPTPSNR